MGEELWVVLLGPKAFEQRQRADVVGLATALPKTSSAQVRAPSGVTLISLEINRRSRLSRGRSISRWGPKLTGRAIRIGRLVSNPKRDQPCLQTALLYRRPERALTIVTPMGNQDTVPAPSNLHLEIERRWSTKPHVDTVAAAVILKCNEERTLRVLNSVDFREDDAPTDPVRVLDGNRVSCGSVLQRGLVLAPSLWNAGVDRQERSAKTQAEQALNPRALQPACRAGIPGPAAPPDVGRSRVYVGADDIGLDLVAIRICWGSRVVDRVEQREKLRRLVALAKCGERHHRPGRRVRILAAVLPNARRIALDVPRILRRLVEWRREQQRQSVLAPN